MRNIWTTIAAMLAIVSTAGAGTVAVITSDAGSGSAFAVHRDADGSVIWCTASHCVGGTVRIAGTSAIVVYQSQADDLAFVRTPPGVTANLVELSDAEPGEGIAHGYPDRVFQSIPGGVEITPTEEDCSDNGRIYRVVRCRMLAPCPPGMSGGVIVQRQRTVGMVTASGGGRTLYVSAVKIRYHLTQCFGGQCRPPQYWVQPRPSVPYIQPPIVWTQPQYNVTPVQPLPTPPQVSDDTRERLDAIERALQQVIESMPTATQGPPGERGPVGPAGLQGQAGPTGLQGPGSTDAQVAVAVDRWMRANVEQVRGPAGETGPKGTVTVIVKDREQVKTFPDLTDGREVTVPIDRITRVNQ